MLQRGTSRVHGTMEFFRFLMSASIEHDDWLLYDVCVCVRVYTNFCVQYLSQAVHQVGGIAVRPEVEARQVGALGHDRLGRTYVCFSAYTHTHTHTQCIYI